MIEISNRHFQLLIDKLPRVLGLAKSNGKPLSLKQYEDIRQLSVLHGKLLKKKSNIKNNIQL